MTDKELISVHCGVLKQKHTHPLEHQELLISFLCTYVLVQETLAAYSPQTNLGNNWAPQTILCMLCTWLDCVCIVWLSHISYEIHTVNHGCACTKDATNSPCSVQDQLFLKQI